MSMASLTLNLPALVHPQEPALSQERYSVQCSLHVLAGNLDPRRPASAAGPRKPPKCPHFLLLTHSEEQKRRKSGAHLFRKVSLRMQLKVVVAQSFDIKN